MIYLMLFVEGILTFLSPCILPLIPIYLSYFGAKKTSEESSQVVRESVLFVLGFSLVFILLSLFVNTVGRFILVHRQIINMIAGGIIIFFGIDQLLEGRFSSRIFRFSVNNSGKAMNSFLLGLIFSVSWSPCVGVYLSSALALSMTANNYLETITLLLTYSLGLGLPFILSAILIDESKKVFDKLKPHLRSFQIFSALLMIIFGLSVATGLIYTMIPS